VKSLNDLDIYLKAYELAILVHELTFELPKYELHEQGRQVRRSSKSIKDNIAEGYGRKRYKGEFIRYLVFALASCNETISQLNMISDIHFKEYPIIRLINNYEILGKKINKFIQYVEKSWKTNNQ